MHKSIRNLTRLFERIQQFEKQLKKRGQLDRADAEALVAAILLLARALQPFAPHAAEGILIDSGRFTSDDLPGVWPDADVDPGRRRRRHRRRRFLAPARAPKRCISAYLNAGGSLCSGALDWYN